MGVPARARRANGEAAICLLLGSELNVSHVELVSCRGVHEAAVAPRTLGLVNIDGAVG